MFASRSVNPSVKTVSASFNIEVRQNFVLFFVFDPGPDGLGLAGDVRNFRNDGFRRRASLTFGGLGNSGLRKTGGFLRFRDGWLMLAGSGFSGQRRGCCRE